jgi:hypothetical protein
VVDPRRQRVGVQRHPGRHREGAVVLQRQPAQPLLVEPRVDGQRVDPAAEQGVGLVRRVPGRVPLQPPRVLGEQSLHHPEFGHRRHRRPVAELQGQFTAEPVGAAPGVPGDRGTQLGDGAVRGENARRLDDLLERPAADQHQGDPGTVQLQEGGRRVVGQLAVRGVPERAARPDHGAVEVGVDDPRGHRHILASR